MTIKKSTLDGKWYYRVINVCFLVLPFVVIAVRYIFRQDDIVGILEQNAVTIVVGLVAYFLLLSIVWQVFFYIVFGGIENDTRPATGTPPLPGEPVAAARSNTVQQQVVPLVLLIVIVVVYVLYQRGDIKLPKIDLDGWDLTEEHTYGTSCTASDGKTGLYGTNGHCLTCSDGTAVTDPNNSNCSNGIAGVYCCRSGGENDEEDEEDNVIDGCIPTGCGNLWYCSGSYWLEGVEVNVPGACYPSGMRPGDLHPDWSGTCRQCP